MTRPTLRVAAIAEGLVKGLDHGDGILAGEEGRGIEGEQEQRRLLRQPVLRPAYRRDRRDLDRHRHAEHRHIGRLGEGAADELGWRPDLLEAIETVGKAGRHLGELPERPQDVGAAGESGGPRARDGDVGADQPVAEKIGAGAEARALMGREAPILQPRRGVAVEAEQGERHVRRLQRPRRAAQGFADAGLGSRMADAGDALR